MTDEAKDIVARLRDPTWKGEDHDPKALYRTRPIALFEAAADMIERLSSRHPDQPQAVGMVAAEDLAWLKSQTKHVDRRFPVPASTVAYNDLIDRLASALSTLSLEVAGDLGSLRTSSCAPGGDVEASSQSGERK